MRALKVLLIGVMTSSNIFAGVTTISPSTSSSILALANPIDKTSLNSRKIQKLERLIFNNIIKLNQAKSDQNTRLISYYKKRIIKHVATLQGFGEMIELPQLD